MGLDYTGSNVPERLRRSTRSRNSVERRFKGVDAGEKGGDGRVGNGLGKLLFTKALLSLGIERLKLVMRLKFVGTKTWVMGGVLQLRGLKDLRSNGLK